MLINPRIQFDINESTQVVGEGKHIMLLVKERVQALSDEEAMELRDALDGLIKLRRAPDGGHRA